MKTTLSILLLALVTMGAVAQNGTGDVPQTATSQQPTQKKHAGDLGFQLNIDVEGNFSRYSGTWLSSDLYQDPFTIGGISPGMGLGVRFRKFLYVGAAFNFFGDWATTNVVNTITRQSATCKTEIWVVPIYLDTRVYLPTPSRCYPYFEMGIGGYVGLKGRVETDSDIPGVLDYIKTGTPKDGFYFTSGIGVELKYVNIGLGYKYFDNIDYSDHYGYVKLGISLGHCNKFR